MFIIRVESFFSCEESIYLQHSNLTIQPANKMLRTKKTFLFLIVLLQSIIVFGQQGKIKIPAFNDKYSKYVQQLENGKTDIDFADFRNSFLESAQYDKKGKAYDSLKTQVYTEVKNRNYAAVVQLAQAMLSIDYTSMFAHKYLQQTYKILGDSANRDKYKAIEFGLLNSITHSGDGKTCETGWHVIQIEEEYFFLYILGATLNMQSLTSAGSNHCDRMDVKTEEGEKAIYYFEVNKVVEMEGRAFKK
jgi:hypothetical protein